MSVKSEKSRPDPFIGHASLETTQLYTQVSIKKLKEIHRATHPAGLARSAKTGEEKKTKKTIDLKGCMKA